MAHRSKFGSAILSSLAASSLFACGGDGVGGQPVGSLFAAVQNAPDDLFVGDNTDDTVKRYDAATGQFVAFARPQASCPPPSALANTPTGCLDGPRGMFFAYSKLYVASQRPTPALGNAEILRYLDLSGTFSNTMVPLANTGSAFNGQGIVIGLNNVTHFADRGLNASECAAAGKTPAQCQGRIARFQTGTTAYLGDMDLTGAPTNFHPRGVVVGPDGLLYVASINNAATPTGSANTTGGDVFRFDMNTRKFKDVFVHSGADNGFLGGLNRPDGLAFGPDGRLYVTTFNDPAAAATTTDGVVVYNGSTGAFIKRIDWYAVGGTRVSAQGFIFGPGGRLTVPLTTTGEVRSYDVGTGAFTVLVPAGRGLLQARYVVYRSTNPTTLAYAGL